MFKFSGLPLGLLALTVAAPVFAQPASTPTNPASPSGTMAPAMPATPKSPTAAVVPQTSQVDINSATTEQLKALPGVSEADSMKIIRGRPYSDKHQLVSRRVLSEATYDKIKDHVVAKQPKS